MDKTERSISLVFGYLPNIDFPNKVAVKNNLDKRLSVSLDTYRSSSVDAYFDAELLIKILPLAIPKLKYTEVMMHFEDGTNRSFLTLNKSMKFFRGSIENTNEPFERLFSIKTVFQSVI